MSCSTPASFLYHYGSSPQLLPKPATSCKIESLELLTDDENGLLLELTVAYRPFPALKIFRDRFIALNAGKLPADMWEYPTA